MAKLTQAQLYKSIVGTSGKLAKRNVVITEPVLGTSPGDPGYSAGTVAYDEQRGLGDSTGKRVSKALLTPEPAESQRVANLTGRALATYKAGQREPDGQAISPKARPLPSGYLTPGERQQFDAVRINTPSETPGIDAGDPTFRPGREQSLTERIQGGPSRAIATKSDEIRAANITARAQQIFQGARSGMAARLANYRGPRDLSNDATQVASLTGRSRKKLSAAGY